MDAMVSHFEVRSLSCVVLNGAVRSSAPPCSYMLITRVSFKK